MFSSIIQYLDHLFMINILDIPFTVWWLVGIGIFLTFKFRFVNFRYFGHIIQCLSGKYDKADNKNLDKKERLSPLSALATSAASTLGMGNIAGAAIALSIAGPGVVVWIFLFGLFAMNTKFTEVVLGHKYRTISKDGTVTGGAFFYLRDGLKKLGFTKIGLVLSFVFAIAGIITINGFSAFQMNQSISVILNHNTELQKIIASAVVTILIGIIMFRGIKFVGKVAVIMVPFMAVTYFLSCFVVIIMNKHNLGSVICDIFSQAFSLKSGFTGLIFIIVTGAQRAVFATEAGLGTSPMVNSNSSSDEPVRQGFIIMIEPVVVSFILMITCITIMIDGGYKTDGTIMGIEMTRQVFSNVSIYLGWIFSLIAFLFGFSTILTNSFYIERIWIYLFNKKSTIFINIFYIFLLFISGFLELKTIIDFSNVLSFIITIPNIIGLYMLSGEVKKELDMYLKKFLNK